MLFPWISQTFELKNNDLKKKKGKTGQCIVPLPLVLFSLWAERWVGREGAMPRELSVLQFYNRRKSEGGKRPLSSLFFSRHQTSIISPSSMSDGGVFLSLHNQARTVIMCLVAKLCSTLCDPMDCLPPGSSVLGISQARILEWVAISFSRGSSWPRDWTCISHIGRRILYH